MIEQVDKKVAEKAKEKVVEKVVAMIAKKAVKVEESEWKGSGADR